MKQKTLSKKSTAKSNSSKKTAPEKKKLEAKKYSYARQIMLYLDKQETGKLTELEKCLNKTGGPAIKLAVQLYPGLFKQRSQLQAELSTAKRELSLIRDKMSRFKEFLKFVSGDDQQAPVTFGLGLDLKENECKTCGKPLDEDGDCPNLCDHDDDQDEWEDDE